MWRYLRAAFYSGLEVPGLGLVPTNILALVGVGILGFVQPALWLLGLGLETAFLFTLALNPRFQKLVDIRGRLSTASDAEQRRQGLVQLLDPGARQRLSALEGKCRDVLEIYRHQQAEAYVVDSSFEGLERLSWVYLKLLVARHHLVHAGDVGSEAEVSRKIAGLEQELQQGRESESLRTSQVATLAILKQRLANLKKRGESLREIDADLTRVEEQVDLIVENVSMQGKPEALSADIELASDLASGAYFGDSGAEIADLDEAYFRRVRPSAVAQGQAGKGRPPGQ